MTREAEAVRLLRQSKAALSSHGPCRDNGCSECRRTFDEVRAFLASPPTIEEGDRRYILGFEDGRAKGLEEAEKVADGYANLQEQVAREKALDAPASSATHEECAYVGWNISRRIRALASKPEGR